MTPFEAQQKRASALLELHDAVAEERNCDRILRAAIESLREISTAHSEGRLKTDSYSPKLIVGSQKAKPTPSPEDLYAAVSNLEKARERVAAARQECDRLKLDLGGLG